MLRINVIWFATSFLLEKINQTNNKSGGALRHFNAAFGLMLVLLTGNGPPGTPICGGPSTAFKRAPLHTHLKFGNKLRMFRPQDFLSFDLPDETR